MNARRAGIGILWAAVAAAAVLMFSQRREMGRLMEARAEVAKAEAMVSPDPSSVAPAPARGESALNADEKLELMELRNRVATLRERLQTLSAVTNQAAALQRELALVNNLASGQRPPDYVRVSDAQFLGTTSPEATLQSLFWALGRQDTNAFSALFTAEAWAGFEQELATRGTIGFFSEAGGLPGYRIARREVREEEGRAVFEIEILPGVTETMAMQMRRVGGAWLLETQ
jgi:hypothetical protein